MTAAEKTAYLRDEGWRALHHQQAGYQQAAQQCRQAARDQTQVAIASATAETQADMNLELQRIEHVVEHKFFMIANATARSN